MMEVTVPGVPRGKPRMTRRDVWKKRPCVMDYRAWADDVRKAIPAPTCSGTLVLTCYFPLPASWSPRRKEQMLGQPHQTKPDGDNVLKGIADALFPNDSFIWDARVVKYWDDGAGPRVEIRME